MSILSEMISDRLRMIQQQIPTIEKALQKAPEGRLRMSTSKNHTRFYVVSAVGSGRYLRCSEKAIAKQLAQKGYDRRVLKLLKKEEKLLGDLDAYYKKTSDGKNRTKSRIPGDYIKSRIPEDYHEDVFFSGPEELLWGREKEARKQLIMPLISDTESYVREWMSEDYVRKGFRDSDPEYYTGSGIRVRSKTELIIAEMLEKKGIPFYYERPLYLEGLGIVHPDFTVLNKKRRKTMYWEHMGMMDDESYCAYALERIDKYFLAGYLPGRNLILTHETAARPIRTGILEKVIEEYLLR